MRDQDARMHEMPMSWGSYGESEDYDQDSSTSSSTKSATVVSKDKNTVAKLVELMNRTGYRVEQVNGQRRFGGPPPGWNRPQPPRGSEIFVGKLPRDCYEDEIVPVFEKCGMIYELRLMMDFSGTTRGYCFIMYTKPEEARCAVTLLDNFEIRPGRRIGVVHSVNNCRLYIGAFPPNKTENEIAEVLRRLTEGVESVTLCEKPTKGSKDRSQYALVEYDSHRSAAMARRRLIPERIKLWGRNILVDWAAPPGTNLSNEITRTQLTPLVPSHLRPQVNKRLTQLPYTLEEMMDQMLYESQATHNKENAEPQAKNHCLHCHCLQHNRNINQSVLNITGFNPAPGSPIRRHKGIWH